MRCYIVSGAISDTDWTTGLKDPSTRLTAAKTCCDWMEIHCQGNPGNLHLTPHVDRGNLLQFCNALNSVMRPGGRNELLACYVATFGGGNNTSYEDRWRLLA
jgi:hypothetical protein